MPASPQGEAFLFFLLTGAYQMEQVYLAPCTEYQYEPLKQAVDDILTIFS
ncbi:MAG: hypothetical protein V8Q17_08450 [Acutalibacteraceae bacterium]